MIQPPAFHIKETRPLLAGRARELLTALDGVIAKQGWSQGQIREHQFQTLRKLVTHAFDHVPLYRHKYEAAGFRPWQLQSLDDLDRIPLLTKADLRKASGEESTSAAHAASARKMASSGSTGIPSAIHRDEASLWHFTAKNTALYHEWCGGRPISEVLYIVDMAQDSIDYALADLLRTTVTEDRILSVKETPEHLLEKIRELAPEFISSYPSTMRSIALLMHGRRTTDQSLRLLHLTSEMLDRPTRSLLSTVFPKARLIETYTCTEAGLVAFECMKDSRLHLAEHSVIHEIVDEAGHATMQSGELVVTDLTNFATPIIRYRGLGDFCRWESSPCPCGSTLRSIRQLEGRVAQSIARRDGTLLSPYAVTNAIDEIAGFHQYQVIQRGRGEIEVLVVKDEQSKVTETEMARQVEQTLMDVLQDGSRCLVQFVAAIKPEPGAHKVPLVISREPPAT
jgi:phenylacetate-CoA ligase